MERLDWRLGLSFSAYGVSVGMRTNDPAAVGTLRWLTRVIASGILAAN
jgi:hypothetical protein